MARHWLAAVTFLATASLTGSVTGPAGAAPDCGPAACLKLAAAAFNRMPTDSVEERLHGYDITETGLQPVFPRDYVCSPLTSLYASWIDVDRTRRDERHSGIDGGRLGDSILAPADGTVRRVWVANWGQGREGALLMVFTREDLNLSDGPELYYAEFDHLKYSDISGLKEGQRIKRGERIGTVFRPGGKRIYLPEVHFEVYTVADDSAIVWKVGVHGTEYFENPTSRLIDPLYMFSLDVRPDERLGAELQPFDPQRDYSTFKGFTYHLPCHKRGQSARPR